MESSTALADFNHQGSSAAPLAESIKSRPVSSLLSLLSQQFSFPPLHKFPTASLGPKVSTSKPSIIYIWATQGFLSLSIMSAVGTSSFLTAFLLLTHCAKYASLKKKCEHFSPPFLQWPKKRSKIKPHFSSMPLGYLGGRGQRKTQADQPEVWGVCGAGREGMYFLLSQHNWSAWRKMCSSDREEKKHFFLPDLKSGEFNCPGDHNCFGLTRSQLCIRWHFCSLNCFFFSEL